MIRSIEEADDSMIDAEDQTDAQLAELKAKYAALCAEHDELRNRVGIGAAS